MRVNMNGFEKFEVKIEKELLSRLRELSETLGISLNRIINTSLFDGILPYWMSYQQILSDISNKESSITEEDYQDTINTLIAEIDSDFENIQNLGFREQEFEKLYPFGSLKDLEERRAEFIAFFKASQDHREEKQEEVREQEKVVVIKPVEEKKEEKEEKSQTPSLISRFLSFLKLQVTSHTKSYGDVITHIIFIGILATFNYFIFFSIYLTWPYLFDFQFMVLTLPLWESLLTIVLVILLFPISIIITGFFIGKGYYFLISKVRH